MVDKYIHFDNMNVVINSNPASVNVEDEDSSLDSNALAEWDCQKDCRFPAFSLWSRD